MPIILHVCNGKRGFLHVLEEENLLFNENGVAIHNDMSRSSLPFRSFAILHAAPDDSRKGCSRQNVDETAPVACDRFKRSKIGSSFRPDHMR